MLISYCLLFVYVNLYIVVCQDIEVKLFDSTQMRLRRLYLSILLFISQARKRPERHTYIREIKVNGFLDILLIRLPLRQLQLKNKTNVYQ